MHSLTITILGAGISGLTAALALRKQGHHVTILEKSSFLEEVGAAITLGPNCTGILERLGMKPASVGANLLLGFAQYTGSGEVMSNKDMKEANKQWANPWFLIHRVDLHSELKRLTLDPDGKGPTPLLHLGCMATELDTEKGVVKLDDGRVFTSDVILGADGNFSFARKSIDPSAQPFPWGLYCYRWLVPRQELLADPEVKDLIGGDGWFTGIVDRPLRIIIYPCRHNTLLNFAAFVPNDQMDAASAASNQKDNRSILLEAYRGFFPAARKLLSYAPANVKAWRLYDLKILPNWYKDSLALIGDAAHPLLPFLGQGGAMAIEDAASIAQVLPAGTAPSDVPQRLELYDKIRHERATFVQEQTRWLGGDGVNRPPFNQLVTTRDYCHNHDEWENSARHLLQSCSDIEVNSGVI